MQLNDIVLKAREYDAKQRIQKICEFAINEDYLTREQAFEYGVLQGIRLMNGEIDRVLRNKNASE